MSLQRKIRRGSAPSPKPAGHVHRQWAERHFRKWGDRAVDIAIACRAQGMRDLVIPVENIPECIPALREKMQRNLKCQEGGGYSPLCRELAVVCIATDSGFVGFFCEAHGEKRAVRLS